MKQVQRGFTLIELMIVVAIIGILAAIAIPSYQDYTARAQVSEAATLAASYKLALAEHYQTGGGFNAGPSVSATQMGNTTTGKYVDTISFTGATAAGISIVAQMKGTGLAAADVASKTLIVATTNGGKTWVCSGSIEAKYRPAGCK